MKFALALFAVAVLCFADSAKVSRAALMEVEAGINDAVRSVTADPYDLLGTARGTYIEGYGALITVELNLVYINSLGPFRPAMTKEDVEGVHQRKLRKLDVLRDLLRQQMLRASTTLTGVQPKEQIAIEAFLWNYNWETTTGLPHRILLSAERQKLLDAKASKAGKDELKFIQERDL